MGVDRDDRSVGADGDDVGATARLQAAGYGENWIAEGGMLRCFTCTAIYDPELVTGDEVVRFEGPSDPGGEAILFALSAPCGQYSAAFGPDTSVEDVEVIVALGHNLS
ncbi:MAG: hypothetical protein ACSLFI_11230 [Solirubrobacterales bacterium]